ncbi:MAG: glutathione S-transferase N-terminal domain-containing protein, partial [Pseudomonadota bacterium]|nr:glutathione S-transferase N-terminal domain-containing protein [Pseudomonadota bacterium]
MAETILYSFRRCPYAMRARMALSSSGLEYEHREVVLRDKPPEMLEVSPKGTVPVLVTETGKVIEESLDIMRHALAVKDPEGWLERDDPELVAANDGPFKHHLDRYKYATRYADVDPEEHRSAALDIL